MHFLASFIACLWGRVWSFPVKVLVVIKLRYILHRSFRQKVSQLQKKNVFNADGKHTFFIPVDEGFKVCRRTIMHIFLIIVSVITSFFFLFSRLLDQIWLTLRWWTATSSPIMFYSHKRLLTHRNSRRLHLVIMSKSSSLSVQPWMEKKRLVSMPLIIVIFLLFLRLWFYVAFYIWISKQVTFVIRCKYLFVF